MNLRSLTSFVSSIIKNVLFSYLTTFLLLLLFSFLMLNFHLPSSSISFGILAIYFLSCFLGGFLLGKQRKEKKFLWGFCLGACYFLILLLLSFSINHTIQSSPSNFFTACLLCMGSGMLGGMLS